MVDESAVSLDKFNQAQSWLATSSRHRGHSGVFIAHRLKQISTGIRSQCTLIFLFACGRSEVKEIDDEYDLPEVWKATRLKKFEFAMVDGQQGTVKFGTVDPVTMTMTMNTVEHEHEQPGEETEPETVPPKKVKKKA